MQASSEITRLLQRWSDGDEAAGEALAPLVYDELHKVARRIFAGERPGHTLQPTAIVNEAYANLIGAEIVWQSRVHFLAVSARMMRRLLINQAEARAAAKRGGGALHVALEDCGLEAPAVDVDMLDLRRALAALEAHDARKAELIDLFYFSGLTVEEIHQVTGLSIATIGRDLRFARAWLSVALTS